MPGADNEGRADEVYPQVLCRSQEEDRPEWQERAITQRLAYHPEQTGGRGHPPLRHGAVGLLL